MFADVNGITIAYDQAGQGYPLMLIHGYPQTRRMWRRVIPSLTNRFSVVNMDLRGYGESGKPPEEAAYDKRSMGEDILALARHLGWDKFLAAGHDRGGRATRRLAADHPEALAGAMLLDILPLEWVYNQGAANWHWYFLLQRDLAEGMIGRDPRFFASYFLNHSYQALDPQDVEHYLDAFSQPGALLGSLGDYRTAYDIDLPRWNEDNRQGRKIQTPLYVIWGEKGGLARQKVLDIWREVAVNVRGEVVPESSHFVAEEQPQAVVDHIMSFADELGLP